MVDPVGMACCLGFVREYPKIGQIGQGDPYFNINPSTIILS